MEVMVHWTMTWPNLPWAQLSAWPNIPWPIGYGPKQRIEVMVLIHGTGHWSWHNVPWSQFFGNFFPRYQCKCPNCHSQDCCLANGHSHGFDPLYIFILYDHGFNPLYYSLRNTLLYHGQGHYVVSWNFSNIFSIVNKKTVMWYCPCMYAYCLAAA